MTFLAKNRFPTLVSTYNTSQTPCCLALLASDSPFLVVGMYELENRESQQAVQQRVGSLELLRIESPTPTNLLASTLQHLKTSFGILDLISIPGKPNLAAATSVGTIALFHAEASQITPMSTLLVARDDTIVTQIRWSEGKIGFTTASGAVGIVAMPPAVRFNETFVDLTAAVEMIHEHSLEAWCLAFSNAGVWSGGDDAVLSWASIPSDAAPAMPYTWSTHRIHGAGVTAVQPINLGEKKNVLITGSYDDHIRILRFSDPPVSSPSVLGESNLGGGVWRFKMLEHRLSEESNGEHLITLLVCLMYAGAGIVRISGRDFQNKWEIQILARFEEHESICYGCEAWGVDGSSAPPEHELEEEEMYSANRETLRCKEWTIATCSFYDKKLCFWQY